MASNFQNFNGDHLGEQDVKMKSFTTPRKTPPLGDTSFMSQSQKYLPINHPPGGRPNMFPPRGREMGLPSQPAKRNPVTDSAENYPTRNQYMPHLGTEHRPPTYSTAEQVQYLASQMHEILQEIREIKGFAGLINSINTKVEHVINQNNQLNNIVSDIQYDVSNMKSQILMQETERYDDGGELYQDNHELEIPTVESDIRHPDSIHQKLDLHPYSVHQKSELDPDDRNREPGLLENQQQYVPIAERSRNMSPTFENERQYPLRTETERQVFLPTDEDEGHRQKEMSVKKSRNIDRHDDSETEHTADIHTKKKVDQETCISINSKGYKCKKTHESDDNRLKDSDVQEEDSDSESDIQQPEIGIVRPQPRTTSPGIPNETMSDDEEITLKEDQYLEQLALSENFKARDCLDPKSQGADTVICIDTSESMAGEPFKKCVDFIYQFIDYIEEWATEYTIEENIAIVHFGSEAKIMQQLTNDYNKVREAVDQLKIGGPTPMMTGLVIAMSALFNRGGPVTVHNRQINPRVILLSDGNATDHRIFEGRDILQPRGMSLQMIKDKLEDFAERVKLENRHIISVPVGDNINLETLRILAETTGGHVSPIEDVKKLSRAFFIEVMISQTRWEGITAEMKNDRQEIAAIARSQQNGKDLTQTEMNEVVTRVIQETEEEIEISKLREQQRNEIDEESEMEVGLRVRRGPDWMWGDQDGFGTGTVIGHRSRGYVRVKWDCGNVGRYRHGAQNAHDLMIVDEPRILPDDVLIAEGVYVKKGKDWEWDDQDGGDGSVGCVYHFEDEGIVHVRWENGIRGNYRFGGYGKIDLQIITPQEYERIKLQRKHQAEAASSDQQHGGATSSNIQTDSATGFQSLEGGTSSNIQGSIEETNMSTDNNIGPQTSGSGDQVKEETSNITQWGTRPQPADSSDESTVETSVTPVKWQYELDGQWEDYSEKDCKRIETLYSTRKSGTMIVSVGGENCRVVPHKMKQKNTRTDKESKIRRLEQ